VIGLEVGADDYVRSRSVRGTGFAHKKDLHEPVCLIPDGTYQFGDLSVDLPRHLVTYGENGSIDSDRIQTSRDSHSAPRNVQTREALLRVFGIR